MTHAYSHAYNSSRYFKIYGRPHPTHYIDGAESRMQFSQMYPLKSNVALPGGDGTQRNPRPCAGRGWKELYSHRLPGSHTDDFIVLEPAHAQQVAGDLVDLLRVYNHSETLLSSAARHVEETASPINGCIFSFQPVLFISFR
jgi:hypothetical protein